MTNPASQQPAPIPEDLKDLYDDPSSFDALLLHRFIVRHGLTPDNNYDKAIRRYLIERCARLEAALTALRDFMWSEGYADQTAVMRQADAALSTPLGTPGSTKEHITKENRMNHEVIKDKLQPGDYRVEAIDPKEGDVFTAIFVGPNAQDLAKEYASWKNQ